MSGVPYTFGNATTSIPLSQLDVNFATPITLGNAAIQLGNTVTTLGNVTIAGSTLSSVNIAGGSANGVVYLNTSNVATANASVLAFNGSNLGLGVTPSAWGSGVLAYQTTGSSFFVGDTRNYFATNIYLNSSYSPTYITSNYALEYYQDATGGTHKWFIAPSGTAGNPITFTQSMTLDSSGNLLVGTTSQFNGGKVCVLFDGSVGNGLDLKTSYSSTGSQFIDFRNSGGIQIGYITQNGSTTINYVSSSDARLKTLIGVATDTSVIDNIVVNDFTWKTDNTTDRGVFAQDAYNVKPSAVSKGKDDVLDEKGLPIHPWGVDYSKFVPDLIVYCQQLKKQVTELSAKVTALEAKVGV